MTSVINTRVLPRTDGIEGGQEGGFGGGSSEDEVLLSGFLNGDDKLGLALFLCH